MLQAMYMRKLSPYSRGPICCLQEGLFLGCVDNVEDEKLLRAHNIRFVFNLGRKVEASACSGVTVKNFSIRDDARVAISRLFQPLCQEIGDLLDRQEHVCLTCDAGVSRSATIVLAIIMTRKQVTLRSAFGSVRRVAPHIMPNNGFMRQLLEYEQQLYGKTSLPLEPFQEDWGFGCMFLDI